MGTRWTNESGLCDRMGKSSKVLHVNGEICRVIEYWQERLGMEHTGHHLMPLSSRYSGGVGRVLVVGLSLTGPHDNI